MIWNRRFVNTAMAICVLAALLGAGQHASAKVIYTPFAVSGNGFIPIDLNHDKTTDFTIHESVKSFSCGNRGGLTLTVAIGSNDVVVSRSNFAAIFTSGILIDSSSTFHKPGTVIATVNCPSVSRQVSGYLGLAFPINGQSHYGWALLEVNISQYGINTKLLGFAYETIAGQGIRTGQISGTTSASETPSESSATAASRTDELSANIDRGMLGRLTRGTQSLTVDANTGEVKGTPTTAGTFSMTVTVSDSATPITQVTATYDIDIVNAMSAQVRTEASPSLSNCKT